LAIPTQVYPKFTVNFFQDNTRQDTVFTRCIFDVFRD